MPRKLWSPNEVMTSSDVNTYLANQVVTTCTSTTRPTSPLEGMLIFETDTNMFRYYTGTAWRSIITSVPSVLLTKGTASIANDTVSTILWDAEVFDNYGMWTSGSTVTIPVSGMWIVGLTVRWASQTTAVGQRSAQIFVNSTAQNAVWLPATTQLNGTNVTCTVVHPMGMNAGDIIEGKSYQSSGGSLNLQGPTRMWAYMIAEGT